MIQLYLTKAFNIQWFKYKKIWDCKYYVTLKGPLVNDSYVYSHSEFDSQVTNHIREDLEFKYPTGECLTQKIYSLLKESPLGQQLHKVSLVVNKQDRYEFPCQK